MALFPWILWGASLVVGAINCYIVCAKVEKTGLERLGATGHLFKYEKDDAKNADKGESK